MTVDINEVKRLIEQTFVNSKVNVIDTVGDGNHLEATIVSDLFINKSLVERHKMVYDSLGKIVGNEIHALSLIVKTTAEASSTNNSNPNKTESLNATNANSVHSFNTNTNLDNDILLKIDQVIKNSKIVLFMKGEKDMPLCGFSSVVVQILNLLQVEFEAINVLSSEEVREAIKVYSNWPTIPQLYINSKFIGGADIVQNLYANGELVKLLAQENIPFSVK